RDLLHRAQVIHLPRITFYDVLLSYIVSSQIQPHRKSGIAKSVQHLLVEADLLTRGEIMWNGDDLSGHSRIARANAIALDFESETFNDLLRLIFAKLINPTVTGRES